MWQGRGSNSAQGGGYDYSNQYSHNTSGYGNNQQYESAGNMISTDTLLGTISQLARNRLDNDKLTGALDILTTALAQNSQEPQNLYQDPGYSRSSSQQWSEGRISAKHRVHSRLESRHGNQSRSSRRHRNERGIASRIREPVKRYTVWIGNILFTVRTSSIRKLLSPYGCLDTLTRLRGKFCVLIDYNDMKTAERVIKRFNGYNLEGKELIAQLKEGSHDSYSEKSDKRTRSDDRKSEEQRSNNSKKQDRVRSKINISDSKTQKTIEDLPVSALKCHICELYTFSSQNDFLNHLKSDFHIKMSSIYNDKNESIKKMFQQHSNLSILKEKQSSRVKLRGEYCGVCDCYMLFQKDKTRAKAILLHENSTEHKLVEHFQLKQCCGRKFENRSEYEDHKLTFDHMKTQLEKAKSSEKDDENKKCISDEQVDEVFKEYDEFVNSDNIQSEDVDDLVEYDPNKPVGMNQITWHMILNCTVCNRKSKLKTRVSSEAFHVKSIDHYMEVDRYLHQNERIQNESIELGGAGEIGDVFVLSDNEDNDEAKTLDKTEENEDLTKVKKMNENNKKNLKEDSKCESREKLSDKDVIEDNSLKNNDKHISPNSENEQQEIETFENETNNEEGLMGKKCSIKENTEQASTSDIPGDTHDKIKSAEENVESEEKVDEQDIKPVRSSPRGRKSKRNISVEFEITVEENVELNTTKTKLTKQSNDINLKEKSIAECIKNTVDESNISVNKDKKSSDSEEDLVKNEISPNKLTKQNDNKHIDITEHISTSTNIEFDSNTINVNKVNVKSVHEEFEQNDLNINEEEVKNMVRLSPREKKSKRKYSVDVEITTEETPELNMSEPKRTRKITKENKQNLSNEHIKTESMSLETPGKILHSSVKEDNIQNKSNISIYDSEDNLSEKAMGSSDVNEQSDNNIKQENPEHVDFQDYSNSKEGIDNVKIESIQTKENIDEEDLNPVVKSSPKGRKSKRRLSVEVETPGEETVELNTIKSKRTRKNVREPKQELDVIIEEEHATPNQRRKNTKNTPSSSQDMDEDEIKEEKIQNAIVVEEESNVNTISTPSRSRAAGRAKKDGMTPVRKSARKTRT